MRAKLIAMLSRLLGLEVEEKKRIVRRFYHVGGFGDDTAYIEYIGNGKSKCVDLIGLKTVTSHSIEYLEKCVADGDYYEVNP